MTELIRITENDGKQAAKLGGAASRICKAKGYTMESLPDPRFGKVRTYPMGVLKEVFDNEPLV